MLLIEVNSKASCGYYSDANNQCMSTRSNADTISKTPEEDAARLREMVKSCGKTQADFAAEYDIGSQAQLWQYLNPTTKKGRPLNITAAIGFARGLNRPVSDFSPSLQEVIDRIARFASSSKPKAVHETNEPTPIEYVIAKKSKRELEIEQITTLLKEMDDRGVSVTLDKAREMAAMYPAVKQTPKSSA